MLESAPLVEHALRNTLVADALSLQFRVPPANVALPAAKTSASIAGSCPHVETLVVTSVWAVHVLRTLCQVHAPAWVDRHAVRGCEGKSHMYIVGGLAAEFDGIEVLGVVLTSMCLTTFLHLS